MNRRTKALQISPETKQAVAERDSIDGCPCCIFCGAPHGLPEAHFIPRSQGGLGIEQNILTVCRPCHDKLDRGPTSEQLHEFAWSYLLEKYGDLDVRDLVYQRGW